MKIMDEVLFSRKDILRYSVWIEQKASTNAVLEIQKEVMKKVEFEPTDTGFHLTVFFIGELNDLVERIMTVSKCSKKDIINNIFSFIQKLKKINIPSGEVSVNDIKIFHNHKDQLVLIVKPYFELEQSRNLIKEEFSKLLSKVGVKKTEWFITQSPNLRYQVNWKPHISIGTNCFTISGIEVGESGNRAISLEKSELKYWISPTDSGI
jgi:2'-5' RNA ligase